MALQEIYLDNAATTKVAPEIIVLCAQMMRDYYGNPSSLHKKGLEAELALEKARADLAQATGCREDEIIFTSGATEANNLALFGAARAKRRRGKRIVANATEHSSVIEPLQQLEKEGFEIVWVKPKADGSFDLDAFVDAVDEQTILLSCMLVNNETGAICDIASLCGRAKAKKPDLLIHCDAVAAFGKLAFSAHRLGVDLMSLAGHKIHAPKGVGALYLKKGVRILPMIFGGGQQAGIRPGTESVMLPVAFAAAALREQASLQSGLEHAAALKQILLDFSACSEGVCINSPADALPYIVNLSIPGIRSEIMLHFLEEQGIYVSSGSACAKGGHSHVLAAQNMAPRRADAALRISFSKETTRQELEALCAALKQGMETLMRA